MNRHVDCLIIVDGTDTLTRNVDKELPSNAAQHSRKSKTSIEGDTVCKPFTVDSRNPQSDTTYCVPPTTPRDACMCPVSKLHSVFIMMLQPHYRVLESEITSVRQLVTWLLNVCSLMKIYVVCIS